MMGFRRHILAKITLVAIDLAHPEDIEEILVKAETLADISGTKLAVITVIPDFGMSMVGAFFEPDTMAKALEKAKESLHHHVKEFLGSRAHDVLHVVEKGTVYEAILSYAEKLDATLIVMGAHRPTLENYLLGPNVARVVRHSTCSVHVIRPTNPT